MSVNLLPPEITGHIDLINVREDELEVEGWAMNLGAPERVISLCLHWNGNALGESSNTLERPDLPAAGLPASRAGFRFIVPRPHDLRSLERLDIRDLDTQTPIPITEAAVVRSVIAFENAQDDRFVCKITRVCGRTVEGWAYLSTAAREPLSLRAIDEDGVCVARFRTGQWTAVDVPAEAGRRLPCGFTFEVPRSRFDGRMHSFRLVEEDSSALLPHDAIPFDGTRAAVGYVECITSSEVTGWALSYLAEPGQTLVRVVAGREILGEARPADARLDTERWTGNRDLPVGFRVPLRRPIGAEVLDRLKVLVVDTNTELAFGSSVLAAARQTVTTPPVLRHGSRYRGNVDESSSGVLSGWVMDVDEPDRKVIVHVYQGAHCIAAVSANGFRKDVASAFKSSGAHGFAWRIPTGLRGNSHADIRIFPAGATQALPGSPGRCYVGPPGVPHTQDFFDAVRSPFPCAVPQPSRAQAPEHEPSIALITLNRNGAQHLEALFESFARHNTYASYRFVIIDHGSMDDSVQVCGRWSDRLRIDVFQRGFNFSFSESNNFAADRCSEDVLVLLNNDIVFIDDILARMVIHLDNPDIGAVGLKLLRPSELLTPARNVDAHHLGVVFDFSVGDRPFLPHEIPTCGFSREITYQPWHAPAVTAAFMMVRRDDFLELGGFDEGYFYGYEDVELNLGLRDRLGKQIVCANDLSAVHLVGASRSYTGGEELKRISRNCERMEARLGAFLRRARVDSLFADGIGITDRLPRIAFAVSSTDVAGSAADYFTALELGAELQRQFNWEVWYLSPDEWYRLDGFDVVVAMRHDFYPKRIESSNPYLTCIGWARNWFDRWIDSANTADFDQIWAASSKASVALEEALRRPTPVIRIATNLERFRNGHRREDLLTDYCFTGSYFNVPRQLIDDLEPDASDHVFGLFGHNWDRVPKLAPYWRGSLPYPAMPDVYASTRMVVDDANHTVVKWGSVNSRVFDALAAGVLVVSNGQVGGDEVFEGLLPTFSNGEELTRLVDHYLEDDEARETANHRLAAVIEQRHTYEVRAREVYSCLRDLIQERLRVFMVAPGYAEDESAAALAEILKRALHDHAVHVRPPRSPRIDATARLGDDVRLMVVAPGERPHAVRTIIPHQVNGVVLLGSPEYMAPADYRSLDVVVVVGQRAKAMVREASGCAVVVLEPGKQHGFGDEEAHALADDHVPDFDAMRTAIVEAAPEIVDVLREAHERKRRVPRPERIAGDGSRSMAAKPLDLGQGPLVRLRFFPDYRATNRYQTLLYRDMGAAVEAQPGTIDDCLALVECGSETPGSVVFHLHWTSVVLGLTESRDEAEYRVATFLDKLDRFIDAGGRLVWTVHNSVSHEVSFPELEAKLCEAVSRRAEHIHVHSERVPALVSDWYQLAEDKTFVGPHGSYIDVYPDSISKQEARATLGIPQSARVFLFLGQVRAYKGLDELVAAFEALVETHSAAWLVIAGAPVEFDIDSFSERLAAVPNVVTRFEHVHDSELQTFLRAADFMVLPYRQVLTSGSVLLAASFRLPVIAPDVGTIGETVLHGETGFLYDPQVEDGLLAWMTAAAAAPDEAQASMEDRAGRLAESRPWRTAAGRLAQRLVCPTVGTAASLQGLDEVRACFVRRPTEPAIHEARRVAIVVLHYRHLEDTLRCLASVSAQTFKPFSLHVVSNDADPLAFAVISRMFPDATVIQSPDNLGYAGGNNLALRELLNTGQEYVWVLNPDTTLPSTLLEELVRRGERYPEVGVFGTAIVFGDRPDTVWFAGGRISHESGLQAWHEHIGKSVHALPKEPFDVDYVTGASLFVRTEVIRQVGLFPEEYFLYFEETDWCLRATAAGYRGRVFPELRLQHWKRSEEDRLPTDYYLYYFCRGMLLMCRKHFPEKVEQTVEQIRELAGKWKAQIAARAPTRLARCEYIIERGIEDGLAGVTGRSFVTPG